MKNTGDASFPWWHTNTSYALRITGNPANLSISPTTLNVQDFSASDAVKNGLVTFSFPITAPMNIFTNVTKTVTYQMYKDGVAFGQSVSRNIVIYNSSTPMASSLYGDWYYFKLWNPSNQLKTRHGLRPIL